MQQIITAKLKLMTTPEQYQLLRQTQLAYGDALNFVSRYAFEQGKTSNVGSHCYRFMQWGRQAPTPSNGMGLRRDPTRHRGTSKGNCETSLPKLSREGV